MPKEAFGGDDSGGEGGGEKKRAGLSRFGLEPDTNIRDVFWKVMSSYAAAKKPELSTLEHDRFSLMHAALSVLSGKQDRHYDLTPSDIAAYSVMMMVDGGWKDTLGSFLSEGAEEQTLRKELVQALKRLGSDERYGQAVAETLAAMLRKQDSSGAALSYIADMDDVAIVKSLRKELIIITRGGIGDDQMNAMKAVRLLKDDEDVKTAFIVLLSHWDAQTRLAAAETLGTMAKDSIVRAAVAKRIPLENDVRVKSTLEKIIKKV